jgi:hypothetical protein
MTRALCAAAMLAVAMPVAAQRGPAAAPSHVPADVLALACSPTVTSQAPAASLHVTGGQDAAMRWVYAPGDLVTLDAGKQRGIEVGQQFYVRRLQRLNRQSISSRTPATIHTAGWLRIYAVDDTMSLATIEHACDSIEVGDYLEPFALPDVHAAAEGAGAPEKDHYARVMLGTDLRQTFGKGDFFIINRGSREGVAPGTRFVVYRDKRAAQNFLFELGEATAVEVKADTATLQVTLSRDAIAEGDLVAQRR